MSSSRFCFALATLSLLHAAGPVVAQYPTREVIVDATSDAFFARVDLATGTVLPADAPDSSAEWQLAIRRFAVNLGDGVLATNHLDNTLATIAAPDAATATSTLPRFEAVGAADIPAAEQFTAAFPSSITPEDSPPFLYGIDPANPHAVVPTFNIYLIRHGEAVYKVQFLSYYHPLTSAARMITLRTARVR